MKKALTLPYEPTVHQASGILGKLEQELADCGATIDRDDLGAFRFRMPRPWRGPRVGVLLAISSGRVAVSAGAGGPWRVRYDVRFGHLTVATVLLSILLALIRLGGPRVDLVNSLIMLWLLFFGGLYAAAAWRFHQLVRRCVATVVERRRVKRDMPTVGGPGGSSTAG